MSDRTFADDLMATGVAWQTATLLEDIPLDSTNVMDFGAVGDGIVDDAPAINAALAYIRANLTAPDSPWELSFPSGRYLCKSSLNFTPFASSISGGVINGHGSQLIFQIAGGIGIDALGSRWMRWQNLTLFGDPVVVPKILMQIGRVDNTTSADYHTFINVNFWGTYSFAGLYNHSSEVATFYSCYWNNSVTAANAFCMVNDGLDHWVVTSKFVTVTATPDTRESFKEATYVNCAWQGQSISGVIWQGVTEHHKYIRCYASNQSSGSNIFTIYQSAGGAPSCAFLDVDCHCETNALANIFVFTGAVGQTFGWILGFSYEDPETNATVSVFAIDGTSSLTSASLRNARLRINLGPGVTPTLFDTLAKWTLYADHAALGVGLWSGSPAYFSGAIESLGVPGTIHTPEWARVTATNGGTLNLIQNANWVALFPASYIATYTVVMPPLAIHGQTIIISTTNAIAALTITGNTGQAVSAQPGGLQNNSSVIYRWDAPSTAWRLLGQLPSAGAFGNLFAGVVNGVATVSMGSDTAGDIRIGNAGTTTTPYIDFLSTGTTTAGMRLQSTGTNLNFQPNQGAAVAAVDLNGLNGPLGGTTPNKATVTSVVVNTSGPTITSGSGVPGATTPVGSIYLRTGGGVGTTLYVSQGGGTWNAVSGV